jgi:hypothetical protein
VKSALFLRDKEASGESSAFDIAAPKILLSPTIGKYLVKKK